MKGIEYLLIGIIGLLVLGFTIVSAFPQNMMGLNIVGMFPQPMADGMMANGMMSGAMNCPMMNCMEMTEMHWECMNMMHEHMGYSTSSDTGH